MAVKVVKMRDRIALRLFAAGVMAWMIAHGPQTVSAQGTGLFTGSGLSKGGTGGITGNLGATGFSSTTGGGSGARGAAASSGLGAANPFAAGGTGGTGFGGAGAQGAGGLGGTMGTANSGFIGRNSGTFAGNSRAGQTGLGGVGAGAARNFNRTGNSSANELRNRDLANGGRERTTSQIRPRQKVAFDYNAKAPATVAATAAVRLDRVTLKNPSLKGVVVAVEDNQIVLRGKVKTTEQSRLAENLVRLEPGVRSVRNELEVEQPTVLE